MKTDWHKENLQGHCQDATNNDVYDNDSSFSGDTSL